MKRTDRPAPILVVMLDGVGDRPWAVLADRTPLGAAHTPNLDAVARASATGILHSLGRGRAPGTELAHFVLFGYPPAHYPGRAVFEAAGAGVATDPTHVILHAIFVTVERQADGSLTIIERYPRRPEAQIGQMVQRLSPFEHSGLRITLTHTGREEAIVTVESADGSTEPSTDVTDTDPHNNGWPAGTVKPLDDSTTPLAARATADALTAFLHHAYVTLSDDTGAEVPGGGQSPFLLLKWVSRAVPIASFREHTGMRGTIVSSARIFEGLGRTLGMTHDHVPSLPDLAEDTRVRLAHGAHALEGGADFVVVHSKAPDVAGHSKDPELKRDALEAIDRGLEGLSERCAGGAQLDPDTIVVVTGDHGTPAGTSLIHSGDPVPCAVLARAISPDQVVAFDETACASGSLGHLLGVDFMPTLLNLRGTIRYAGGRLTPHTGLYWPDDYEPFRLV